MTIAGLLTLHAARVDGKSHTGISYCVHLNACCELCLLHEKPVLLSGYPIMQADLLDSIAQSVAECCLLINNALAEKKNYIPSQKVNGNTLYLFFKCFDCRNLTVVL